MLKGISSIGVNQTATSQEKGSGFFYGWVIAAVAFTTLVVVYGAQVSFGVFFEPLTQQFGWNRAVISLGFSFYMIVNGALHPIGGMLTDKYGPRWVLLFCGVVSGLGYFLLSRMSSLGQFYVFYGLVLGVGVTATYVAPVSTVTRWFRRKRGLALGCVTSGVGAGTIVMPPLMRYLISAHGWQSAYLALAVLIWVVVVPGALLLRRAPGEEREGTPKAAGGGLPLPGIPLSQALRQPVFWAFFLAVALFHTSTQMLAVHLVPRARDIGLDASGAATVLSLFGLFAVLGQITLGALSDRLGSKFVFSFCFFLDALLFVALAATGQPWAITLIAVFYGFGTGGTSQIPALADRLFGSRYVGAILGSIQVAYPLGGALGPALGGYIFDLRGAYTVAFLIASAALLLGGFLILSLRAPKS